MHETSLANVWEAVWTLQTWAKQSIAREFEFAHQAEHTRISFVVEINIAEIATFLLLGDSAKPCSGRFKKGKVDFIFPRNGNTIDQVHMGR